MRAPPSLFRTISHFSHTHIRARRGQGHAVRHCAPPALAPARAQHAPCTLVNGGGGKKREQDERERARARERYERAILRRASLFSLFQGRSCIPTAPPPLALEERERECAGAHALVRRGRESMPFSERDRVTSLRERESARSASFFSSSLRNECLPLLPWRACRIGRARRASLVVARVWMMMMMIPITTTTTTAVSPPLPSLPSLPYHAPPPHTHTLTRNHAHDCVLSLPCPALRRGGCSRSARTHPTHTHTRIATPLL